MVAYEFYWLDERGTHHLIGLLPERRSDRRRITRESVMNWGGTVVGDALNINDLYYIQVDL